MPVDWTSTNSLPPTPVVGTYAPKNLSVADAANLARNRRHRRLEQEEEAITSKRACQSTPDPAPRSPSALPPPLPPSPAPTPDEPMEAQPVDQQVLPDPPLADQDVTDTRLSIIFFLFLSFFRTLT
ncbi:unnamed protein product [Peniophora sp. CBMAI 1063]|nr:unnamed protein product [Peniophora sp. CBMAI 1063]